MNNNNFFDNTDNSCNRCHQNNCNTLNPGCTVCPPGPQGPQGPAGGILGYADFYALMPPDNSATVAPGTDVSFPQDGPNSGTTIVRTGASSFNLTEIGTYQVLFQVRVTEAAQLILTLNGADLEYTVVGRATGVSQITPLAGGTRPVSAHLTIMRIM